MEQKILTTALNSASDCLQLKELLDLDTLSPEAQHVFKEAVSFYATDPQATEVDRDLLIRSFERKITSAKVRQLLTNTIKNLPKSTSGANVLKEIRDHKLHVLGNKLASALSSNTGADSLASMLADYQSLLAGTEAQADSIGEEEYNQVSLASLARTSFDKANLIQLWPQALNDQIDGGARRGHHVLIFAPTEMGKTLFAINAVAGFLAQGLRVLYVGNEDPASDIIMRLATRLLIRSKYAILDNPEQADSDLGNSGYNRFTLLAMAPGTFARISSALSSGNYDVVVLDQLRNLDVKSGNRTEGLERAATEARNLARKFNVLVVSVTQAADSASGKRVLNRGDVDSSNVGIPGQCDLMVGIGATTEMEEMNQRMLSFPKNKISGNHAPIPVDIDPITSRVL